MSVVVGLADEFKMRIKHTSTSNVKRELMTSILMCVPSMCVKARVYLLANPFTASCSK